MLHWAVLGAALLASAAEGQPRFDIDYVESIEPRTYVAHRTAGAIDIDGNLDEPSWQRAGWTAPFVDIEGEGKTRAALADAGQDAVDDEYLYIAADLETRTCGPQLLCAMRRSTKKTTLRSLSTRTAIPISTTSLRSMLSAREWDLLMIKPYRDGGPFVSAWDIAGLQTAVRVWGSINDPSDEDQGWSVEMAFPWAVLAEATHKKVPPMDGDQWRINFSRVQWALATDVGKYIKIEGHSPDNWVWSPQGLVNMHYPEKWGVRAICRRGRRAAKGVLSPGSRRGGQAGLARDLLPSAELSPRARPLCV